MALFIHGCTSWSGHAVTPVLRLSPASLGSELSVLQRMDVDVTGHATRSFDTVLEVDANEVRLAVLQLGQTIARLQWDGRQLIQSLAPGWPKVISAESVLSDLQYVWWPQADIQAALPVGWTLSSSFNRRALRQGDKVVMEVHGLAPGLIELIHYGSHYRVSLQTQGAQPAFVLP